MSTEQKHILLVEDDEGLAAALASYLRQGGFRVTATSQFEPALQALERNDVDLLIADIVMPEGVNGLALSRMARLRRPGLPVIYMTGYRIHGIDEQLVGPVLRKPVDGALLLDTAREALGLAAEG